jgi:hypothetical protein
VTDLLFTLMRLEIAVLQEALSTIVTLMGTIREEKKGSHEWIVSTGIDAPLHLLLFG